MMVVYTNSMMNLSSEVAQQTVVFDKSPTMAEGLHTRILHRTQSWRQLLNQLSYLGWADILKPFVPLGVPCLNRYIIDCPWLVRLRWSIVPHTPQSIQLSALFVFFNDAVTIRAGPVQKMKKSSGLQTSLYESCLSGGGTTIMPSRLARTARLCAMLNPYDRR